MILVIDNLESWRRDGRPVPAIAGFRFASYAALDLDLLETTEPEMVVSNLVGDGFDAVDVARRLDELGYTGRYRALAGALPRADTVRAEIAEVAPGLDFDLVVLRPAGPA